MAVGTSDQNGQPGPVAKPERPSNPGQEEFEVGSNTGTSIISSDEEAVIMDDIPGQGQIGISHRENIIAPTLRPSQSRSRRSSSFVRSNNRIVPRSQRRGLFGRFTIIPEVEFPLEYRRGTKWTITAVVALAAAGAPMGSGIFLPALPELARELNTTTTITNLTVAMYMLAMSIFPLWWSSFSETLGRRTIYIISFTMFVVFSTLSAVSVNISMLVVMRILGGGASASVQAVGAGTIADIWEPAERGRAMGIFYLGPLIGPLCSPLIGGGLSGAFGWRSTMWFLTIYGGVMLLMIFFCLPETLANKKPLVVPASSPDPNTIPLTRIDTTTKSIKTAASTLKRFLWDPLTVLSYLRYPPVLVSVYSASICFGALFVLNISIQSNFSNPPYNFSSIILGCLYLPPSMGYITASTFGGRWIDHIMKRQALRAGRFDDSVNPPKLIFLPEDRMGENMWLAASLYPLSLIVYGFTAGSGLKYIAVPAIASFCFGVGSMLVFGAVTTMLTEFMPHASSSGVAVNNFVRNLFSCVGGIVAQPLIDAMGNQWLCLMIGLFAWVTGNGAIWLLKRRGEKWRREMDEALGNAKPKTDSGSGNESGHGERIELDGEGEREKA
ncbi:major facilitator superfamily domain-containing protein [Apiosordaria backusii]|uniref:Major facilitator superfamily domain-containing protein n=1 Tax=Apiosordaria backusii TaxID=314023 RepID=A0AA40ETR0_9PEZI|nr:major facilitator superfamily domain-containing protein [Apiosordaria backusii]